VAFTLFNLIWLVCVLAVLAMFAGWPRAGGIAYLAVVLFAPVAVINETTLRAETVLVPLMLGWVILNGTFRWRTAFLPFSGWIVWLTAVSFCTEGDVYLIGLYGSARFVAVALIFGSIPWREGDLVRAQYGFALSAIPIGLLTIGQVLNVPGARELTQAAYSSTSQLVFGLQMDAETQGFLFRGIGVFGNVSPAAAYFLVAMGVAIILLCDPSQTEGPARRLALAFSLATAIAGGAATLSATFLGGFAPAVAAAVLVSTPGRRLRAVAVAGSLCLLGFGLLWFLTATSDQFAAQLDYQWNRIAAGDVLEGRYSAQEGVLAEAIETIRERPVCGVGVKATDAFHGDSVYVSLLFICGAGGLLLFLAGIGSATLAALESGAVGRSALYWVILAVVTGIGSMGMFVLRFGDWCGATQGMTAAVAESLQYSRRRTLPAFRLPPAVASSAARARSGPARRAAIRLGGPSGVARTRFQPTKE